MGRLVARNRGIQDLTGLQFAINLGRLSLNDNQISDLSPIAGLLGLDALWIINNPVSDISPVRGLTNLTELVVDKTYVSDLSPIVGLINLKQLGVSTPLVSDLSPVRGLTNLTKLWLHQTQVSDLSPLAGLTNLESLSANQGGIFGEIRRIEAETGVVINANHGNISDLSPLAGLPNLKSIWIWGNPVSDLSPLAGLTTLERIDICGGEISSLKPLAGLTRLKELYLAANGIPDISPLASLTGLNRLDLRHNNISDISPLAGLTQLEWLGLDNNEISDFSPLDGLRENITLVWFNNPAFPKGGPKIEGPWLWVILPDTEFDFDNGVDLLSEASGSTVTEVEVATRGAIEGESVGDSLWISHKLPPTGRDNIQDMLKRSIEGGVIYGTVALHSPREQDTTIYVGGDLEQKVWLNGTFIHQHGHYNRGNSDYTDFYPVTLQEGRNVLLVAIHTLGAGFFGFEPGTEYTVMNPGVGYALSKTPIYIDDTFTLDISAKDVIDLAGWQFDIAFDPAVLEAINVSEGDFLKTNGGTTFFQSGSIDNAAGKIIGLSSARLSAQGVNGIGTLLQVRFKAKAAGETELALGKFQFGSITGDSIPAGPHKIRFTVEGGLATGDVNRDGVVSILDLILVAQQLGKRVPAGSAVDVNGDGIVSILDLIRVSQGIAESPAAPPLIPPQAGRKPSTPPLAGGKGG